MKPTTRTLLGLLLLAWVSRATVISGRITDLTGAIQTSNRSVKFVLENCGNNLPRVTGSQVVVPATLTLVPNVAGNLGRSSATTSSPAGPPSGKPITR